MADSQNWLQGAVLYELYVRAFRDSNGDGHGDLGGVIEKLDYLVDLGVDVVWLLPISPSPLRDDGYDISDFFGIHPDYGDLQDFEKLVEAAHAKGLKVITDLILNHTSDAHPWFQASRRREDGKDDWYVWSDDPNRYQATRIIFTDSEPSNWTFDPLRGQYYWHRFFHHQPDLNYDHPEVREHMLEVIRYWLDRGIDGFRLDAIPYLYEREGTNNENLPETHGFLKAVRTLVDRVKPDALLLGEVNQWPEDTLPYFGDGSDELRLLFHFPIMPRLFKAVADGNCEPIAWILERTPAIPAGCQWVVFLRNHDELTLEMVTETERAALYAHYAPEPRMRLNLGIRRRLAPLLANDLRKIKLMYSLLMTLPGIPILYYGDEIGMGDDIWLDDRDGVRTPMQWGPGKHAGFSEADTTYLPAIEVAPFGYRDRNVLRQEQDPESLLHWVRRLITVRKDHPALGGGSFRLLPGADQALAVFVNTAPTETVVAIHNLSDRAIDTTLDLSEFGSQDLTDAWTGAAVPAADATHVQLEPYDFVWLVAGEAGTP